MSVGNLMAFHADGRMRGCFVYMLLCQEDGPIYIKVGKTVSPSARLQQLKTGCPFVPRIFAVAEVGSKGRQSRVEFDLHVAFKAWHSHGEWFAVNEADRARFNAAWKPVLSRYSDAAWHLKWQQFDVGQLDQEAKRKKRFAQHNFMRNCGVYEKALRSN